MWRSPYLLAIVGAFSIKVTAQDPTSHWTPNHESLGMHCFNDAPNPNYPLGRHNGGCGCENTPLRLDGTLYIMESTGHGCDYVFPGYNSSIQGDCSYFRIRDAKSGYVIANVSESLTHSFFAAVADHSRRTLWVFGTARNREDGAKPNKCDGPPYRGCYVGAWSASFDDLNKWTHTREALTLPDGYSLYNNDVAIVSGDMYDPGLPKHQAVMIFEQRTEDVKTHPFIAPFAVNIGTDGDLGTNWKLLSKDDGYGFNYTGGKGAAGEGTSDAPAIRFDSEEGYYYSIGGGWITNGPARSKDLKLWDVSPRAPMAVPDTRARLAGLPVTDTEAGINTAFYTALYENGVPEVPLLWAKNLSQWNWGVTDPDLCCSDGQAPSYLINCLSRQGAPSNFTGKSYGFSRIRRINATLNEWLRSYFVSASDSMYISHTDDQIAEFSSPRCSPTKVNNWSNYSQQAKFMRRCIQLAKDAVAAGGSPYGALIVDPTSGKIVVEGRNHAAINSIWHGEMDAINSLANLLLNTSNCSIYQVAPSLELYTSAEPCPMCSGAIGWSQFGVVVFGTNISYIASQKQNQINVDTSTIINAAPFTKTQVVGGILANETDLLYKRVDKI